MSRGIEGKEIFTGIEECRFFLSHLENLPGKSGYLLYAWRLTGNHYHLLIRVNDFPPETFMRLLNGRYAQYAKENISIEDVVKKISEGYGLSVKEIQDRGRRNFRSEAGKVCAFVCNRHYHFPVMRIARYFTVSSPSVSNMIKEGEKLTKNIDALNY